MMYMGLRGFGLGDYASCNAACQSNYDPTSDAFYNCNNSCVEADAAAANGSVSATGSSGSPSNSQPWWSTALTSLTKGVTSAFTSTGSCPPGSIGSYPACQCAPGSPGVYPSCLTAPSFLETPLGIGAILGGVGLVAYMLMKK